MQTTQSLNPFAGASLFTPSAAFNSLHGGSLPASSGLQSGSHVPPSPSLFGIHGESTPSTGSLGNASHSSTSLFRYSLSQCFALALLPPTPPHLTPQCQGFPMLALQPEWWEGNLETNLHQNNAHRKSWQCTVQTGSCWDIFQSMPLLPQSVRVLSGW